MRDFVCCLFLSFALFLILGCVGSSVGYRCPGGEVVGDLGECTVTSSTKPWPDSRSKMVGCERIFDAEDRYACYTNIAVEFMDLSVCDKIKDNVWMRFCYGKLNMSRILPPEETTTTTLVVARVTTTTSTTSTSTTLACGNGVVDIGEECDVGVLCPSSDGVCALMKDPPYLVTCRYNGVCDYSTQVAASGSYDMGACIGCYGPKHPGRCRCMKPYLGNSSGATW